MSAAAVLRRPAALVPGLSLLLLLLLLASLTAGSAPLNALELVRQVLAAPDGVAAIILLEIRLPRSLLAALIGASLGLSGATLQGLLRNPLADPGIVGVSATAAFGAVLVIYFGLTQVAVWTLPLGGMAGAALAAVAIVALAGRDSGVLTIILAGIAVTALANALTALALNLAPSPYAALEIVFWLLGSLADRSLQHLWLALPLTLIGWALLLSCGRALDALSLGEDAARTLGFDLRTVQLKAIGGTAACVGAAVAVSGSIGFVGLVVPHLLRPLVGQEPARLLPVSALGGACLLLAADIAVRTIEVGPELKLGVVTALIGAPFFLHLILKTRRALT